MDYTQYVPTQAEIAAVLARNCQDELDFHERVLHDLLELGRDIVNVTRQKALVQSKLLTRDPRDIELRHHKDLTIPFERLARGIRQAILLHEKILEQLKTSLAEPDLSDQPPDQTIVKACQDLAAALGPNITIPDTSPHAALETLRAHLATIGAGPP